MEVILRSPAEKEVLSNASILPVICNSRNFSVLRDAIPLYSQLHFGLYLTSMVKVGLCTAIS